MPILIYFFLMVILMENKSESPVMEKKNGRCRINAYVSKVNYAFIDDIMANHKIANMRMTKGAILDLALTNLFMSLEYGESLNMIAINHLERERGDDSDE